jgi:hypothetical protein
MNLEVLKTYRKIRENNRFQTLVESYRPGWIRYHDSNWICYNDTFKSLLGNFHNSLVEVVDYFKEHKPSVRGLDLLGTGGALEGLGLDQSLGVALEYWNTERRELRRLKGIDFIPGDVMLPSTWDNINNWTTGNGLFQLILCRPGGPFVPDLYNPPNLPNWPSFYYRLLRKTYRTLDQDGILLSQVPFCCIKFLPQMKEQLKEYFTLTYPEKAFTMMLQKRKPAGVELPKSF